MENDSTPEGRDLGEMILGELYRPGTNGVAPQDLDTAPPMPEEDNTDHRRASPIFVEQPELGDLDDFRAWGERVRSVLEDAAMSDLGNAQRLLAIEGAGMRYVHDLEHWIVQDEQLGHWSIDADGAQARQRWHGIAAMMWTHAEEAAACAEDDSTKQWAASLKRFALRAQSRTAIDAAVNVAATLAPLRIASEELDANPLILAVRNGVLDLVKRELRGCDSEDAGYCTMVAGVDFDPDATCPEWERHIAVVSSRRDGTPDPDLAAYLQRWAGYNLTGLVSEQKFAFGYGEGSNGKNVLVETQMKVMGDYAMPGSAKILSGDASEHETIIADLAGRRLVFIDEAPKGRVNDARVKALTGTGRIRARKMRQDSFEFPARFKLWIAGNNKPRITDTSEGMWRRLDLIPFDATIPPGRRVRDYADLLYREEGPGILNWALDGLASYREVGLAPPRRVTDATGEYRAEETSDVAQFVSDTFTTVADKATWLPNPVIHGLYEAWCTENGVRYVQNMRQLGPELKRAGFESDGKTRRITMAYGETKVTRGWRCPPLATPLPSQLVWS